MIAPPGKILLRKNMRSLIICPVGNPLTFDTRFDKENHWRYTSQNRLYDTLIYQYNEYEPEENTYDVKIKKKGFKWALAKEYLETADISQYEYIGFFDDDLITDMQNINGALELAHDRNLKIFQLSVTNDSDIFYPILRNNPALSYATTNFVEVMGPFIHTSLISLCVELWSKYDIYTGWGFDKVLCDLTKENAAVIHKYSMYHPKKESSYDKTNAFSEMNKLLSDVFPKFMKSKYGEEWSFKEDQKNIELFFSKE